MAATSSIVTAGEPGWPRRQAAVGCLLSVVLSLMLGGCGSAGASTRSATAVCHVWDTEGLALHNRYVADGRAFSGSSPPAAAALGAIGDLISSPSQLALLLTDMANVAPPAIEGSFQQLAQSFNEQQKALGDALSNPLGALGDGLLNALGSSGAVQRVDNYLSAHCGVPGGRQSSQ